MKNGTYQYSVKMSAPIGPRYGNLELNILDGSGNGFLTMFSRRLPVAEVRCRGGALSFSGIMETLLYPLPYTASGTVGARALQMVFRTSRGCFPAEGILIADDGKGETP